MKTIENQAVAEVFAGFSQEARAGLMQLRDLIFAVAAETAGVGRVDEVLRWGQPAYLARKGSTIRLGVPKTGGFALYVICSTSLIEEFRPFAPKGTRFEGTRAVLFRHADEIDEAALCLLVRRALTYHM